MKGSTCMYWMFIVCMLCVIIQRAVSPSSEIIISVITWGIGIFCLGISKIVEALENMSKK